MRIPNRVIPGIAQVLGGVVPQNGDTEALIPPTILPQLEVPQPLNTAQGGATTINEQSFLLSGYVIASQVGIGGTPVNVAAFQKGMWRIRGAVSYVGNTALTTANFGSQQVYLKYFDAPAVAVGLGLWRVWEVTNTLAWDFFDVVHMFSQPRQLVFTAEATAAVNVSGLCIIEAHRLL